MSADVVPMDELQLRALPIDSVGFEILRSSGQIYVDKAQQILKIAVFNASFFISRPRRFGKTLLLSAFASLFEHGLKYFEGLKLKDSYVKAWEQEPCYPVLRLDFSLCNTFSEVKGFITAFEAHLADALIRIGFKLPEKISEQDTTISRFGRLLDRLDDMSLVLLVDEYDSPLNHCLNDEKQFSLVRDELFKFYSLLKSKRPKFRFVFMTGISKYKNLGIFSGTNNFTDLSLMPEYGTLLGYTKDEIVEYFSPFVKNAANTLKQGFEECLEQMAKHYDGFCFDSDASTHVYVPWSVLNFMKYPQRGFINYWYESGGQPSVLLNYIKKHSLYAPEAYGKDQRIRLTELDSSRELSKLNDLALLFQSGYLSIKRSLVKDRAVVLNYPNIEVAHSMASLYTERLFGDRDPFNLLGIGANELFESKDPEEILKDLNRLYLEFDYSYYPVKDESSVRSHMQMFLRGDGIRTSVEIHNAYGRSDLEFVAGERYYVMEFKYQRKGQNADLLLKNAVEQLKDKHYGDQVYPELTHICMALVFSQTERQFVKSAIF